MRQPPLAPYRIDEIELHDRRTLGFCEFGDPDGDPVLWFHGTPGGRRQIPPDAPAYAVESGIRIVTPERGGVGASTSDFSRTLASWGEDVHQFVDELGIDRFGVAGLSGGAPHVLAVANLLPDRVIAGALLGAMAPMTGPDAMPGSPDVLSLGFGAVSVARRPLAAFMTAMFKRIEMRHVDTVFPWVLKVLRDNDVEIVDTVGFRTMLVEDLYLGSREQFTAQVIDMAALFNDWGFSPRDVTVPIRSWHGSEDSLVPLKHAQHLNALMPNAELVVVEGGGHFAGYAQAPNVLAWLKEQSNNSKKNAKKKASRKKAS